jgi:RNA recognition motif-containing protein
MGASLKAGLPPVRSSGYSLLSLVLRALHFERIYFVKLFIRNLPYSVGSQELLEAVSAYGETSRCEVALDRETGSSRGFAWVDFVHQREGMHALSQLNESEWRGRVIYAQEARPQPQRLTYE